MNYGINFFSSLQVLKKPNKFSVVIDDDVEDEVENLKNNENFLNNDSIHSSRSNSSSSTNSSYDELAKKNWHEEIVSYILFSILNDYVK